MAGDRQRHATGAPTALRTTSTTRSCCSRAMPAHSGTEKFSRASFSVSGSEPSVQPRKLSAGDRKSTRLNSSHDQISYAVFCLKKKNKPTYEKLQEFQPAT